MLNGCLDYILKPVEEEELIAVLRKVSNLNRESIILRKDREKMEDAYLEILFDSSADNLYIATLLHR